MVVARTHNKAIADHVRNGASLLLLPEADMAFIRSSRIGRLSRVQARDGTLWSGDWASSFAWLRRSGTFRAFPERAAA